jgi:hypothetical protein
MSDGFTGMLGHPSLGGGDSLTLSFAFRFAVDGGIGDGARHRIKHGFQQTDHGGDLARSHAFDQFVRLFLGLIVRHLRESQQLNTAMSQLRLSTQ